MSWSSNWLYQWSYYHHIAARSEPAAIKTGLATLCISGGMGMALLVERFSVEKVSTGSGGNRVSISILDCKAGDPIAAAPGTDLITGEHGFVANLAALLTHRTAMPSYTIGVYFKETLGKRFDRE